MYALEEEPEKRGRSLRLGAGAAIAVLLCVGLVYGTNEFEPAARLIERVVRLTVVVEPPPEVLPKEKPPPPPLPRRKRPKQETALPEPKPRPREKSPPKQDSVEEQVGLDESSFAAGTGGPAFGTGNTAMGAPPSTARSVAKAPAPPARRGPTRQARALTQVSPLYTKRARELGIEGLMIVEVTIDQRGRVTRAVVRRGLERELDDATLRTVRSWVFSPALSSGQAVASTRLLRIRFKLESRRGAVRGIERCPGHPEWQLTPSGLRVRSCRSSA